jgi:hypothetical protein
MKAWRHRALILVASPSTTPKELFIYPEMDEIASRSGKGRPILSQNQDVVIARRSGSRHDEVWPTVISNYLRAKCDVNHPCGHCVKVNDTCTASPAKLSRGLALRDLKNGSEAQQCLRQPPHNEHAQTASINLQHLVLLHHLESHTYKTFVMDPKSWKR